VHFGKNLGLKIFPNFFILICDNQKADKNLPKKFGPKLEKKGKTSFLVKSLQYLLLCDPILTFFWQKNFKYAINISIFRVNFIFYFRSSIECASVCISYSGCLIFIFNGIDQTCKTGNGQGLQISANITNSLIAHIKEGMQY
jgi:hypothetical protein